MSWLFGYTIDDAERLARQARESRCCPICFKPYRDHEPSDTRPDDRRSSKLRKLCTGEIVSSP
jgi:hypothetical protein